MIGEGRQAPWFPSPNFSELEWRVPMEKEEGNPGLKWPEKIGRSKYVRGKRKV